MQRNSNVINKKYREYLLPTILTSMATQIASFVDSVLASNLVGSNSIAAISLIMPILQIFYSITLLFGLGASSLISRSQGANEGEKANHYFTISFVCILIISILAVAIQLPLTNSIPSLLTKDSELLQLTKDYYRPFVIGLPIYMLLFSSVHAIRLDGRPRYASMILIVANVVNLCFDYLLMGVFKIGIAGSSWATLIGNSLGLIMVIRHFAQSRSSLKLSLKVTIQRSIFFTYFKKLFTTGISSALGAIFIVLRLQFFISIISAISGAAGLVAFSLCTTVTRLISMFISGASQAMIPLVSLCLGEKDYQGVRFVLKRAAKVLLWASGILMLYFIALPESFISIFGISDIEEIAISRTALIINAFSIPGEAFLFLFLYYFMSVNQKNVSFLLSTMYGLGVLIFGLVLSKLFGINGIWWSMVATNFVALLIAFIVVWNKKRCLNTDFYLIPKIADSDIASFSMIVNKNNAVEASAFVHKFLEANQNLQNYAFRIALAIEEISLQIAEANNDKPCEMDLRICNDIDILYITIRDNGQMIKPKIYEEVLSSESVLRSISYDIEHSQALGFNRTLIKISAQNQ